MSRVTRTATANVLPHVELPARFDKQPRLLPPAPAQVQEAREKSKLTQAQAAYLVYVTEPTWRQYENGRRQMTAALWELFLLKTGDIDLILYAPERPAFRSGAAPAPAPRARAPFRKA